MTPSRLEDRLLRLQIQGQRYGAYLSEGGLPWALMFVGSRALLARRVVDACTPKPLYTPPSTGRSRLLPVDAATFTEALARDGGAEGLRLTPEDATTLRRLGEEADCVRSWHDPRRTLLYLDQHMDLRRACPLIAALEEDPLLLEIAARYLGATPRLLGTRLWWSLARPASLAESTKFGQRYWHYDLHDWRCLKFSFYLTDVTPAGGGTGYVRGSHTHKRLRDQLTLFIGRSEPEIVGSHGAQALRVVTGPAGTGFAFDPYAWHRGTPPAQDRLMLQIEFGRRRYLENCYATAAPLPASARHA